MTKSNSSSSSVSGSGLNASNNPFAGLSGFYTSNPHGGISPRLVTPHAEFLTTPRGNALTGNTPLHMGQFFGTSTEFTPIVGAMTPRQHTNTSGTTGTTGGATIGTGSGAGASTTTATNATAAMLSPLKMQTPTFALGAPAIVTGTTTAAHNVKTLNNQGGTADGKATNGTASGTNNVVNGAGGANTNGTMSKGGGAMANINITGKNTINSSTISNGTKTVSGGGTGNVNSSSGGNNTNGTMAGGAGGIGAMPTQRNGAAGGKTVNGATGSSGTGGATPNGLNVGSKVLLGRNASSSSSISSVSENTKMGISVYGMPPYALQPSLSLGGYVYDVYDVYYIYYLLCIGVWLIVVVFLSAVCIQSCSLLVNVLRVSVMKRPVKRQQNKCKDKQKKK